MPIDYHARIINLPCNSNDYGHQVGHRKARHEAAEVALEAETRIVALEAEVERLMEARRVAYIGLRSAYDFLLRECAEPNPEKGIVVDEGALPTWGLVCDGLAALAGEGDEG